MSVIPENIRTTLFVKAVKTFVVLFCIFLICFLPSSALGISLEYLLFNGGDKSPESELEFDSSVNEETVLINNDSGDVDNLSILFKLTKSILFSFEGRTIVVKSTDISVFDYPSKLDIEELIVLSNFRIFF
jgi:hypothetical protein